MRRRVGRSVLLGSWARPLRALGRFVTNGVFAVVLFNVVMVAWHLPAAFDAAENNQNIHIWLMHASFFVVGRPLLAADHPLVPDQAQAQRQWGRSVPSL